MTSQQLPHSHASTPAYAVLRVDCRKAKSMAAISAATAHQLRTKLTPNADPNGIQPITMFLAAGKTPYRAVEHLLVGVERRNRDTVLCREIVVSASPSYFRPGNEQLGGSYDPERMKAWAMATLAWAKRTWPDQLASMVLHLDEQTPHAHLLVVPRVKKLDGNWKLNSKALFDRERLRDLQSSFGAALNHLGIKRGEPSSNASHTEVRQFYGAIKQAKVKPFATSLPPLPKPPKLPRGISACVSALASLFGFETDYDRRLKSHSLIMTKWQEELNTIRKEDAKRLECMSALAAAAPILYRRHVVMPRGSSIAPMKNQQSIARRAPM